MMKTPASDNDVAKAQAAFDAALTQMEPHIMAAMMSLEKVPGDEYDGFVMEMFEGCEAVEITCACIMLVLSPEGKPPADTSWKVIPLLNTVTWQ